MDCIWYRDKFRYISIRDIQETSSVYYLYCFHAITGCAFNVWMNYNEVTAVFRTIGNSPETENGMGVMSMIERFVVLLYDRTSKYEHVNEARKNLFAEGKVNRNYSSNLRCSYST